MNLVTVIVMTTILTTQPLKEEPKVTLYGAKAATFVLVHGSTVFTFATPNPYGGSVILLRSDLQRDGEVLLFWPYQAAGNLGADTHWRIGAGALWFATERDFLVQGPGLDRVEVHRYPLSRVPDGDFLYPYDKDKVPLALGKDLPIIANNCPLHSSVRRSEIKQQNKTGLASFDHRDQLDFLVRGEWSTEFFFHTGKKIERWDMTTKWDPNADVIPK